MSAEPELEPPPFPDLWLAALDRRGSVEDDPAAWEIDKACGDLLTIAHTALQTARANPERLEMLRPLLTHTPLER